MKRRLYYLLPNCSDAEKLVNELAGSVVSKQDVHAVAKDKLHWNSIDNIQASNENDRDYFVEWFLWRFNLALFFMALIALVAISIWNPGIWLILPLTIMMSTLVSGLLFVLRIPNVHLDEFRAALQHGEVLLMIDVPAADIKRVDQLVHRKHPEAVTGGVCWHL
jgi:hypothetical protein